jgi:hypothetical protein
MPLVQPDVKYYIGGILSECHERKITLYRWILNITVFSLFVLVTGGILYGCYKTKPSVEEVNNRMIRDQNYVLQQIRFYQNQPKTSSAITDLPVL